MLINPLLKIYQVYSLLVEQERSIIMAIDDSKILSFFLTIIFKIGEIQCLVEEVLQVLDFLVAGVEAPECLLIAT